ncbi:N-6 DNA methylase, partial [bacterium]|nr:N-6 DNA methylase [bacterium]
MENSLKNIFERIGLKTSNGLIYKSDESSNINARIKYSLKNIDYDALYALDSNPLIIFKEYNNKNDYENTFNDFLKQIWNLNDIPILFISRPGQIEIYNANVFNKDESRLAIFNKLEDLNSFNIENIVNGSFFTEFQEDFDKSKKVQKYLLDNISQTKELLSNINLPNNIIHGLIGKLIFSKYLIDRKLIDYSDNKFYSIIENKEELFGFFNKIEEKFNLNLYKFDETDKVKIKKQHLKYLSDLFRGHDIVQQQEVLACPYDFSIIPIELISNIYEIFLEQYDETKSFYTPLFLVDYILDNTLDVKLKNNNNCKILDPSCGSGVFLVESLRRIINKNIKSKGDLSNDELINIVKNNIYGVDKDENALYLTSLSITL